MNAPIFRAVEQHSGKVADRPPLSEADEYCRELDGLRELQCRLDELAAERDDLAERLHNLDEAHQITLSRLAKANTDLARARNERDDMRAEVSR